MQSCSGHSKIRTAVSYSAIYVVWGTTYLAISISLETLPVFFISSVRFLVAGGVLLLYSAYRGCARPTKANWIVAFQSGFLSFFVAFGVLTWAQQTLPSSVAALIIALEPAWFVLLDWWFFKGSAPSGRIVLAQVIGFVGVSLLIFSGPSDGALTGAGGNLYAIAALAVLFSGFAWVYGSLLSRSPHSHPDSTAASGLQMFAGGAALFVASVLSGDYENLAGASLRSVLALLYLIVFGSLFAYSAYVFLLRTQPASRVAAHTFVNPIVAVALGWAFAGERITGAVLLSACLVIGSVILTIYARPKSPGS